MWNIIEFDEVASTNTLASEMLARGEARHGDVIQARHQTSGRGRGAGRVWNDAPGNSLLISIILTDIPEPAHLLQYRAALAVLRAIREITPELNPDDVGLKWPNDILIHGKKVCGLLTEAQWNGPAMRSAVVGIGLNVKQRSFPLELSEIATSLYQCGVASTVQEVRDRILGALRAELYDTAIPDILSRLNKELAWMSERSSLEVTNDKGETVSDLRFDGLEDSGALRLRRGDGTAVVLHHGNLSWIGR
jgi:BirA family transcriptional regulator, biotin operon repressor / biotin---[acetyl-CoA-carboxylase] ligase